MRGLLGHSSQHSIATRLFGAAVICSVVILLAAGLTLSTLYRGVTERGFDERLHIYLNELVADLAAPDADKNALGSLAEPRFELPLSGWYWQVTQLDDPRREVRLSKSLVGTELPILTDLGIQAEIGERREGYGPGPDERRLRIVERRIDLGDGGRYIIAVAAASNEIDHEIREFDTALAATFIVLGAALALSTLLQVKFGLRPLDMLHARVAAVRRGEAQHIAGVYPRDIAPLAGELNLLIDTNREVVERARTHVGNLAHALKTPLAVLSNEANGAEGPLARHILQQTTIMRDQVTYHLDRARAAALSAALGVSTAARPVVEGLVRMFAKLNVARGLTISIDVPDDLRIRGDEQDLQEMLGNIVDNACKWAAAEVSILGERLPSDALPLARFIIDDDGPGLAEEARGEVLRRGRRLDESKPGSGLGLSIVHDLVRLHGGSIVLATSPKGGLRAVLTLPAV